MAEVDLQSEVPVSGLKLRCYRRYCSWCWKKNYGFKAPKKSKKYKNLYFTGGSVNPGGGMPMVVLCGQKVADRIVVADA